MCRGVEETSGEILGSAACYQSHLCLLCARAALITHKMQLVLCTNTAQSTQSHLETELRHSRSLLWKCLLYIDFY